MGCVAGRRWSWRPSPLPDRRLGPRPNQRRLSLGTFIVNVTGCLALGLLTGLGLYHGPGAATRTVLGTGGLGAYTTFSTLTFETVRLAEEGAIDAALRNAAANLLVGLAAASVGLALTAAF